jgi:hypothetical protein
LAWSNAHINGLLLYGALVQGGFSFRSSFGANVLRVLLVLLSEGSIVASSRVGVRLPQMHWDLGLEMGGDELDIRGFIFGTY